MNDTNQIADKSWQQHTSRKAIFESPVWMKMLRRSVKDAGILSGLVYGGRSRNLWERLNFHPPEQSREVSHILPNFIHSWHKQCIAENFLPQRFAPESLAVSHTSHFWSGSLSFVISHHIASGAWSVITSDQLILTRLWTDMGLSLPMDQHLRWARNADYVAKPDIMSCPRHWVTVLDGAPAVNSVRQQLILGSHSWGGAQVWTPVRLQTALTPCQTECT